MYSFKVAASLSYLSSIQFKHILLSFILGTLFEMLCILFFLFGFRIIFSSTYLFTAFLLGRTTHSAISASTEPSCTTSLSFTNSTLEDPSILVGSSPQISF